jgi:hypothetical protein
MNLPCLLYWAWLRTRKCELFFLRTNKSFPSQKVITDIFYSLVKNMIITHWPLDMDCIKVVF